MRSSVADMLSGLAPIVAAIIAVTALPDDLPWLGIPHAACIGLAVGVAVFLIRRLTHSKEL